MSENTKFDREFLRSALSLAAKSDVDHFLYICDTPIPPEELRGRPARKKLVYAVTLDKLAQEHQLKKVRALVIPAYDYSRTERVKVALVSALSQGAFKEGDLVLCMTGRVGRAPDTLMQMRIGGSLDDRLAIEGVKLGEEFNSQVVDALIQLALQIGQEGFEGHPIGTIITIGDHTTVLEKSRQMTINPFQGLSEAERNVLDPKIREAIKNFSVLDGAFVIREDGVVLAAGRYLSSADEAVKIPLGLGARHAAAAGITSTTHCIALVVSQTSGAVRLFKGGNIVLELHQTARRT
ncbi:diadenylate cyclase [Myxococcus sp. MISCRS1]|uniref:DNA integrity scanning protein DisA nucleotide-binding domain protein n=1 Tax=Myxococcus TaxID=32 RepID=UPI001143CF63|nr:MULTISPECIES: diadenylate cyclase [Myxococcus]BDT35327.1 diadenylate cyclase [Myxococcus sp. MH1]MBZ4400981.1 diadenylate cyclase [Myxococcus sp. AS-1-15]MBZ4409544.1 diadenylate cyclase [Myxococcus sp. XM-1-1-1]MCK8503704.1 diadenylate cyclase [Myxococcus fulvus]MCP3059904.1 diadenylate cyclase [Myxococcus guangdongensis]